MANSGQWFRPWRSVPVKANLQHEAHLHRLKVLTFNILADKYATSGFHSYADPQHLDWNHRWPLICAELQQADADLVFMQEVEAGMYAQQLQPWMAQQGRASLYHPRSLAPNSPGPAEGVSLHYRSDTFQLQRHISVTFSACLQQALAPGAALQAGSRLLEVLGGLGDGALIALLTHKPSGRLVLACSCHLFWDPHLPDAKLVQAAMLCAQVAAVLHSTPRPADVPVLIAGDFNSLWCKWQSDAFDQVPPNSTLTSGVYQLLTSGLLQPSQQDHPATRQRAGAATARHHAVGCPCHEARGTDASASSPPDPAGPTALPAALWCSCAGGAARASFADVTFTTSGLRLESAMHMAHGREPPLTTRTATFSGTLDYVFVSPQHWEVAATLALPYPEPAVASPPSAVLQSVLGPLPSAAYGSDHLAVGVELLLLAPGVGANA